MSDPIEQPALQTVPTTLLRKRRQLNKEHVAKAILKKNQDKVSFPVISTSLIDAFSGS